MDVAGFIETYGYVAIILGMFLEGELILILAGIAAFQGHLALPAVIVAATLATVAGDHMYFFAGRKYGVSLLARFPAMHSRAGRMQALVYRHHLPLILSIRFLYGLRTTGLVALGMSPVPASRFLMLSSVSAAAWAVLVCTLGYVFGQTLQTLLASTDWYGPWLLTAGIACAFGLWMIARRGRAKRLGK